MTWNSLHRRADVLRSVTHAADARRDGILPADVAGVPETFHDTLDLLGALSLRWSTRLSGRLEARTTDPTADRPADPEREVVAAWRDTAAAMPGVRAVLDTAVAEPADARVARAMRIAADKEHAMLAMMAGRASAPDAAAVRAGAELARRARRGDAPIFADVVALAHHERPAGLLHRLRAALAA